jgi:ribose 1,5-bisphosphokinase
MQQGALIAIVGPSGVGKDTVMAALMEQCSSLGLVQRDITRPCDPMGENHVPRSKQEFQQLVREGQYIMTWHAHGLDYGISKQAIEPLNSGQSLLINLSRNVLIDAWSIFPNFYVINLIADRDTLAHRLTARGRETREDIKSRLARQSAPLDPRLKAITVDNSGSINTTVSSICAVLSLPIKDPL